MNPYPGRNSVLVMDNASIHHHEEIRQMFEAKGALVVGRSPALLTISNC